MTDLFSFEFGGSEFVFLNLNGLFGSRKFLFHKLVVVDFDGNESFEGIELLIPESQFVLEVDEFLRCFLNSSFELPGDRVMS
jgi:hypothetical protein